MPQQSKKLEKYIKENNAIEQEGRTINEELVDKIRQKLIEWGGEEYKDYDPVIEMAKIANSPGIDDSLKYRANSDIASYMYPKVKSMETRINKDNNLTVNIKIAPYAQKQDEEIVADELELSSEDEDEIQKSSKDYSNYILKNTPGKLN